MSLTGKQESVVVFDSDVVIEGSINVPVGGGGSIPERMAIDVAYTGTEGGVDENGVEIYRSVQSAVDSLESRRARTVDQECLVSNATEIILRNLGSQECCVYLHQLSHIKFTDEILAPQPKIQFASGIFDLRTDSTLISDFVGEIVAADAVNKLRFKNAIVGTFFSSGLFFDLPANGFVFLRSSDSAIAKITRLVKWETVEVDAGGAFPEQYIDMEFEDEVVKLSLEVDTVVATPVAGAPPGTYQLRLTTAEPHQITDASIEIFTDAAIAPRRPTLVQVVDSVTFEWIESDYLAQEESSSGGTVYFHWFPAPAREGAVIEFLGEQLDNFWCLRVHLSNCTDITFEKVGLRSLHSSFSSLRLDQVNVREGILVDSLSIVHQLDYVSCGHFCDPSATRAPLSIEKSRWHIAKSDTVTSTYLVNFCNATVVRQSSVVVASGGGEQRNYFITSSDAMVTLNESISAAVQVLHDTVLSVGNGQSLVVANIGATAAKQSIRSSNSRNSGKGRLQVFTATRPLAAAGSGGGFTLFNMDNSQFMMEYYTSYRDFYPLNDFGTSFLQLLDLDYIETWLLAVNNSRLTISAMVMNDITLANVRVGSAIIDKGCMVNVKNVVFSFDGSDGDYGVQLDERARVKFMFCVFSTTGNVDARRGDVLVESSALAYLNCQFVDFGTGLSDGATAAAVVRHSTLDVVGCAFIWTGLSEQLPPETLIFVSGNSVLRANSTNFDGFDVSEEEKSQASRNFTTFSNYPVRVLQLAGNAKALIGGARFESNAELDLISEFIEAQDSAKVFLESNSNILDQIEFIRANYVVSLRDCSSLSVNPNDGRIFYREINSEFTNVSDGGEVCISNAEGIVEDFGIPYVMNFVVEDLTPGQPWYYLQITIDFFDYEFTSNSRVFINAGDELLAMVEDAWPQRLRVAVTSLKSAPFARVSITNVRRIADDSLQTLSSINLFTPPPIVTGPVAYPDPTAEENLLDITPQPDSTRREYVLMADDAENGFERSSFFIVRRVAGESCTCRVSFATKLDAEADADVYPAQLPYPASVPFTEPTAEGVFEEAVLSPYSNNTGTSNERVYWLWADHPVGATSTTGSTETEDRLLWVYLSTATAPAMVKIETTLNPCLVPQFNSLDTTTLFKTGDEWGISNVSRFFSNVDESTTFQSSDPSIFDVASNGEIIGGDPPNCTTGFTTVSVQASNGAGCTASGELQVCNFTT